MGNGKEEEEMEEEEGLDEDTSDALDLISNFHRDKTIRVWISWDRG